MEVDTNEAQSINTLLSLFSALKKIGESIIISITQDSFSLRSLNSTCSALPVVAFKSSFFRNFSYTSSLEQLVFEIPAASFVMAFKNVISPVLLKMVIYEDDLQILHITLGDRFGISHFWEFAISETNILNAVYDMSETTAQLKLRYDIFDGLSDSFRGVRTIYMEIDQTSKKGSIEIKSCDDLITNKNASPILSSTLTINKSERCEMLLSDDFDHLRVAFSLKDFLIGVKISKLFSQYLCINIIGPGQPVILQASSSNVFKFEMPLATINDNDLDIDSTESPNIYNDNSDHQTISVKENSLNVHNHSNESSQVSLWPLKSPEESDIISQSKKNKSENNENIKLEKETITKNLLEDKKEIIGRIYKNGLYDESPPYPLLRKIIEPSVIVQASQPPSENEYN